VFDHKTPAALVKHLLQRLQGNGHAETNQPSQSAGAPLLAMVARAADANEMAVAWQLIDFAVRQRPTANQAAATKARIHRVESGPGTPHFICVPSPVPPHGPSQFLRLARALRGTHSLSVVSLPGYAPAESLLTSVEEMVSSLADAALECAAGEPFIVLGYSSGGYLAYEVGHHLERMGAQPAGIVLLDTPIQPRGVTTLDKASGLPSWRAYWHFELPSSHGPGRRVLDDGTVLGGPGETTFEEELTAMARYQGLLMGGFVEGSWEPYSGRTRTLMVSCTKDWNVPGTAVDVPPASRWHESHAVVKVPGDHYTFLTEYASMTAAAILAWTDDAQNVPVGLSSSPIEEAPQVH
jgi:thioesterase domain-containing protein